MSPEKLAECLEDALGEVQRLQAEALRLRDENDTLHRVVQRLAAKLGGWIWTEAANSISPPPPR